MCRNHVCPHFCCSPEGKRQKRIMQRLGGISVDKLRKLPEPWRVGPSHGGSVAERAAYAQTITDSNELAELLELPVSARVRIALASAPGLTAEQQSQVAEDEDARVRLALAKNPVTDEDVLKALAGDTDAKVQAAAKAALEARATDCPEDAGTLRAPSAERIAELAAKLETLKPATLKSAAQHTNDPEMLTVLADHEDKNIRMAVARNEATDQATLARLAEDESDWVRMLVAPRVTDRGALVGLANDSESRAAYAAIQNPAMSPDDLDALAARYAEEDNTKALALVAGNPNTSTETLERLVHPWANLGVLYEAGTNPNLPVEKMRELAKNSDPMASDGLLRNPSTPSDILEELSHGASSGGTRAHLASHPNTPPSVLERLVERGDTDHLVASHPNASGELLEKLASSGENHVTIAQNPATPPALLDKLGVPGEEAKIRRGLVDVAGLAQSDDSTIRGRVARATTDREVFISLLADGSKDVRTQALRNPLSDEYIDKLAGDRAADVRKVVAARSTDPGVLATLAGDSDQEVREAVAANAATPAETLYELACYNERGARNAAEAAYAARGEEMPAVVSRVRREVQEADEKAQQRLDQVAAESAARRARLETSTDTSELASAWAEAKRAKDRWDMAVIANNPAAPLEARAWRLHRMDADEQKYEFDRVLRETGDKELYRQKFRSPKAEVRMDALELPDTDYLPEVARMAKADRAAGVREAARAQLHTWAQRAGDVGAKAQAALDDIAKTKRKVA